MRAVARPRRRPPLERLHGRVQRQRQEDRDDDPREHLARDPGDVEQEKKAEGEPENGEDRGRANADDPLFGWHRARIAARSDVSVGPGMVKCSCMSLRGTPIEQEAELPDGRVFLVRVGVLDDSYVARREIHTVALELVENGQWPRR